MKTFFFSVLLVAVMICHTSITHAGGWTQPKGKGYFKLSEQIISANSVFRPNGDKWDIPVTVNRYTTSFYGEFGLVDRVTLVGYMPIYQHLNLDGDDTKTGVGDWDVGIRIGLLTNSATVVSIQAMAGLPLGEAELDEFLWTGDGEFNQHVSLQLGHSLYPLPAYLKGEIGFNNRKSDDNPEDDYADEIRYSLEAGYTIAERVGISVWLRGVDALGELNDRNDFQYLSYGPEIHLYITPNAGIAASMTRFTRGYNVLDAPAWEFGVFLKL